MTDLASQRRLAAGILGVGRGRVWLDPAKGEDIAAAITREDIRGLVGEGTIRRLPPTGQSRGRFHERKALHDYGHRKGHGSRKGRAGARRGKKVLWVSRVRRLRARLKSLRESGALTQRQYRTLYRKVKGGEFKSLNHLDLYIQTGGAPAP
ncbi:MAG: 50S ribosomal protein L19e, partial [Euryarchaeota archaeon]|nr:50S ribosomal protein L19e [Euryarchaeota archaeon]